MRTENAEQNVESSAKKLGEIAVSCLKLGTIGFGGIAGEAIILAVCLVLMLFWKQLSTIIIILIGSIGGFILLKI